VGQGMVPLKKLGNGSYVPDIVKPRVEIRFKRTKDGVVSGFSWSQFQADITWTRAPDDSTLEKSSTASPVEGIYVLSGGRPVPVWIKTISENTLQSQVFGETSIVFKKQQDGSYLFSEDGFEISYAFSDLKNGRYQKMLQKRKGDLQFVSLGQGDTGYFRIIPNTESGFNATDSLQGTLTPLRSSFDVRFYDLDIFLDTKSRFLKGSNTISFEVLNNLKTMQLDLFRNMHISAIHWKGKKLPFNRKLNAVFIEFDEELKPGTIGKIRVEYSGYPQPADFSTLSGGFLWVNDRNGKTWMQVVTQGTGASLWWPCKDHLSDEPDSMRIRVTIPETKIKTIANGILRNETRIGDTAVQTEWFVSYPINTYNVTLNIGDYQKLTNRYYDGTDSLKVNFYYLPYNRSHAESLMRETLKMLPRYQQMAGPYPFNRDGFTLLEAPYPMEHQGAVSIGSINDPIFTGQVNMPGLISMVWHEGGHEWWGNNVSMSDNAEIWFHEAFTTYLELIKDEKEGDQKETVKKLNSEKPSTNEKMLGEYGVNHFKLNLVYNKGAFLVHTLRNIINDDNKFFALLRGIQKDFALKTTNSDSIVNYICRFTDLPLKPFFAQYLGYPAIPKAELRSGKNGALEFRWKTDVKDFSMPVILMLPGKKSLRFEGSNEWRQVEGIKIPANKIKIDKKSFYVD
ncbi:MAG: M1 family metallopeptidase, partial [Flavitalea sp.]